MRVTSSTREDMKQIIRGFLDTEKKNNDIAFERSLCLKHGNDTQGDYGWLFTVHLATG